MQLKKTLLERYPRTGVVQVDGGCRESLVEVEGDSGCKAVRTEVRSRRHFERQDRLGPGDKVEMYNVRSFFRGG